MSSAVRRAAAQAAAADTVALGGTGRSSPPSSNSTTPLHSSVHPCSGWLATDRAAERSGARASGHRGRCLHSLSLGSRPCPGLAGADAMAPPVVYCERPGGGRHALIVWPRRHRDVRHLADMRPVGTSPRWQPPAGAPRQECPWARWHLATSPGEADAYARASGARAPCPGAAAEVLWPRNSVAVHALAGSQ